VNPDDPPGRLHVFPDFLLFSVGENPTEDLNEQKVHPENQQNGGRYGKNPEQNIFSIPWVIAENYRINQSRNQNQQIYNEPKCFD
jgi:hypothetical protein